MRRFACIVLLLVGLSSLTSAQQILTVPSATYPTIQSALNAAASGDTVMVAPGTYVENLVWPAVDVTLQGAGKGQSIIDGNQSGSCILFSNLPGNQSSVDGFTLTNGSGTPGPTLSGAMVNMGGGVHITNNSANPLSPTISNCHFTGNSSAYGGALSVNQANVTLRDCDFDNNAIAPTPQSGGAAGYFTVYGKTVLIENCTFTQHSGENVLEFPINGNVNLEITDCDFYQNTADWVIEAWGLSMRIARSRFRQNSGAKKLIKMERNTNAPLPMAVESCLIVNNSFSERIVELAPGVLLGVLGTLTNCTIVRNNSGLAPLNLAGFGIIADCILRGNKDGAGTLHSPPYQVPSSAGLLSISYCNIQGGAGTAPGVVDVIPLFGDITSGDFSLRPGSPMIDAGSPMPASYLVPTTDLRGLPRVRGSGLDMGAFEAQSMAHHPASAGAVGASSGGPFNLLKVNGSAGGAFRRLSVPVGSSVSLSMDQPPTVTAPVQFAVYGMLGEANFDTVVNVPLGIGDMMFAPAPLFPFLHPSFFMLASTFGSIGPWAPLFAASPTPWNSGPGPAIPNPLLLTLQGIIEETPGVYVPTNALIFEVK